MIKKLTLVLFTAFTSFGIGFGQPNQFFQAPQGPTTTQVRAPSGTTTHAYLRACSLVLASELTNLPGGSTLSSFGFTLQAGTTPAAVSGNFTLYLQNTSDVTYQKTTSWATILSGMTTVYASTMTVPNTPGATSITINLSTPFTYTGGGIYVAYDWVSTSPLNPQNTAANFATYYAEGTALAIGGCSSAANITAPATTLGSTAFRPSFLFGIPNTITNDIQVLAMEAPGKVGASLNTAHTVTAYVKNGTNTTINNVSVTLTSTGANALSSVQVVPAITPGAVANVTFAFNPQTIGMNTLSVTVPPDNDNSNNSASLTQSVTCSTWGNNPPVNSFTSGAVGFTNGSGILATSFSHPNPATLNGLRAAVSNDAASVGNPVYGVLLSAAGAVIATTNTVTLTAAMLSTFIDVTFAAPQSLTANTPYFIGFAQTANIFTAYFPAGTLAAPYVNPNLYYSAPLNGGTFTPLGAGFGFFGLEAVLASTVTLSAPSQTVICGSPAVLSATSNATYSWSTGSSSSTIAVSPTLTTVYTITANGTGGCTTSKNVTLTVNNLQIVPVASTPTLCPGSPVTLTVTGATSYTWGTSSGSITTGNLLSDMPLTSTMYTVAGSNSAGCRNTAGIGVAVNLLPNVTINTSTTALCLGNPVDLTAGGAATYSWSLNGITTASLTDVPQSTTEYSVFGTDAAGCINVATTTVTVNSTSIAITGTPAVCAGRTASLLASGTSGYVWAHNNSTAPQVNVTPSVTTEYTVTGTDNLTGCQDTQYFTVTVNANPTVTASAPKTTICKGNNLTIGATGATTYSWTGGGLSGAAAASASVIVSPTVVSTIVYTVTGTDDNGCTAIAFFGLTVNACLGIESTSGAEKTVRLFPNPTTGVFTVASGNLSGTASIEIHNMLGALIMKLPVDAETMSIDLKNEVKGIYFITVTDQNKTVHTAKLIKQ